MNSYRKLGQYPCVATGRPNKLFNLCILETHIFILTELKKVSRMVFRKKQRDLLEVRFYRG
jgi:hypothetical protein